MTERIISGDMSKAQGALGVPATNLDGYTEVYQGVRPMPPLKTYDLFISHAWKYNDEYYRLVDLINEAKWFEWRNYSVPEHDPLGTMPDRNLRQALDRQIRPINVFLLISGMYVNHRDWIQNEIDIAKNYTKPIIGIRPRGAERVPTEVQLASVTMVNWNTSSIIDAIRQYAI